MLRLTLLIPFLFQIIAIFLIPAALAQNEVLDSDKSGNSDKKTLLIFGDSLSSGHGLPKKESWAALLQNRMNKINKNYTVINASISGDTSFNALTRLPRTLQRHQPAIVIVELGSNDGLQGKPLKQIKINLAKIISRCQQQGAKILLVGMQLPPNYGPVYTQGFQDIYESLSKEYQLNLVPFLMKGFAEDLNFFQSDRIHPNSKAQHIMLENIWPELKSLL